MSLNVKLAIGNRDAAVMKQYVSERAVGQGTFGVVLLCTELRTSERVAIKKVIQDPRFRNRELGILRQLNHCNIVSLKDYYYTRGEDRAEDVYLNLVMEFVPDTLHNWCRSFLPQNEAPPILLVKVFTFQLLRSIAYLHMRSVNICHRDIKPHNVLVNTRTGVLKLCDFGSAKQLTNEPNVAYICSRYYRAPELIFGNQHYSTAVDMWSVGCIFGEMLRCKPMFRGESSMDQLVQIMKIIGGPTAKELEVLNTNKIEVPSFSGKPKTLAMFVHSSTPSEAIDLLAQMLKYIPTERIKPFEALCHPFFDDLRKPSKCLPNNAELPSNLYVFTEEEKKEMTPEQLSFLVRASSP